MKIYKHLKFIIVVAGAILMLTGCAGSGTHSTIYYESYHDPYPRWGHGDDTTIIIDLPDKKPERPPGIKPPGDSRPKPSPKRQ